MSEPVDVVVRGPRIAAIGPDLAGGEQQVRALTLAGVLERALASNLDLRVVRSDFIQPFGVFRGQVLGHDVSNVFGVVEDHLAVW